MLTRTADHGIRVRFYESDLSQVTVPLAKVLPPIGVGFRVGEVAAIDPVGRRIVFAPANGGTETGRRKPSPSTAWCWRRAARSSGRR